jgi:hypothetical protein
LLVWIVSEEEAACSVLSSRAITICLPGYRRSRRRAGAKLQSCIQAGRPLSGVHNHIDTLQLWGYRRYLRWQKQAVQGRWWRTRSSFANEIEQTVASSVNDVARHAHTAIST